VGHNSGLSHSDGDRHTKDEEVTDLAELERRLWAAADALRANSSLTPAEYRGPVLGLIFLAFAEHRFDELRPELELKATQRRPVSADDFRARGVLFVPDIARLSWLVDLPEGEDLGANIDLAMDAIEATNTGLRGVLPRGIRSSRRASCSSLYASSRPSRGWSPATRSG
jgi:type I restriction enzyme M protein